MYIYSEKLNKKFDTVDACMKAEKEYDAKVKAEQEKKEALNKERTKRAKEVEDALKRVEEAKKEYNKLLSDFCKDYGTFHTSLTEQNVLPLLYDIFEWF